MTDTLFLNRKELFDPDGEVTNGVRPLHLPEIKSPNSILIVFAGNPNALQFELIGSVVLGRRAERGEQPDIDLAPYGGFPAGVSRFHARLTRTPEGVVIEDLGSRNGTFLNGQRLTTGEKTLVRTGESLEMAHLHGWVYLGKPVS